MSSSLIVDAIEKEFKIKDNVSMCGVSKILKNELEVPRLFTPQVADEEDHFLFQEGGIDAILENAFQVETLIEAEWEREEPCDFREILEIFKKDSWHIYLGAKRDFFERSIFGKIRSSGSMKHASQVVEKACGLGWPFLSIDFELPVSIRNFRADLFPRSWFEKQFRGLLNYLYDYYEDENHADIYDTYMLDDDLRKEIYHTYPPMSPEQLYKVHTEIIKNYFEDVYRENQSPAE